jgi:hypothetical protein
VAGSCEHGNELLSTVNFLTSLANKHCNQRWASLYYVTEIPIVSGPLVILFQRTDYCKYFGEMFKEKSMQMINTASINSKNYKRM